MSLPYDRRFELRGDRTSGDTDEVGLFLAWIGGKRCVAIELSGGPSDIAVRKTERGVALARHMRVPIVVAGNPSGSVGLPNAVVTALVGADTPVLGKIHPGHDDLRSISDLSIVSESVDDIDSDYRFRPSAPSTLRKAIARALSAAVLDPALLERQRSARLQAKSS